MVETATAFIRRIRFYIYKVIDDFTILITTMGPSTELSTWHMGVTWKFSPSVMIFSRTAMVPATMGQIIFASDTILIFTASNNFTKTNSTICQSWAEIEEWSCLIIGKIWCYPFHTCIFFIMDRWIRWYLSSNLQFPSPPQQSLSLSHLGWSEDFEFSQG